MPADLFEFESATGVTMDDSIAEHTTPGPAPGAAPQALAFEYPKETIVSYAQTHEDVLLWRALHNVHRGFYIDVGAHDPTLLSVTRAFYDHGWRGINVEPDPLYAEKLRKERPRDVTLEVALSHSPGMATLYEFGDSGLSTLTKEIADGHMAAGFKATERRIPVTTLAAVLDDLGDQQVHFLKIDVEGYERQVLRGADFAKVRPWIVLLEAVRPMTTVASYGSWEPLLLEAGYEYAYFDGLNRYYIAQEHSGLKRCFSVPVSACDPFRDSEVVRLSATVAELERDSVHQASLVGRLSGVMADLERDRMTQASEAVRLRAVVADLERDKETQASEAVRLRAVVADLERDKETQASEVARLTAAISKLQQVQVKHEVPRLGAGSETPVACDAGDAVGLLRVVEAQASDLVRLRRALVSAQSVAAQRLHVIHADADAQKHRRGREEGKVFEWARSIVVGEIARVQEAIGDVIEWSRWRRIGQRLRLAKRLAWETGEWRMDLNETPTVATAITGDRREGPSIAELLGELERLNKLLDHMRLSRWRKLGHWLGLVKRLPWESGEWRDPLLINPFPSEEAGSTLNADPRARTSRSSYSGFVEYANERFLEECRWFGTDVIFDVGANTGQFAQGLRASGYHGHIISFEPLSGAHATLVAAAASDSLWDVAERCAVGASDSWAAINIAGNSYSSSLLPMLDLHREAAPQSAYQGTEPCRVITLDSYMGRTFSDGTTLFGLKIDTQGYEAEVLAGLRRYHHRVKVIVCEMSLAPLYADGPSMSELCHLLAEFGYRCVALSPEFEDPRTGELLQANGVFVKRC
jgi:FkbM family methyltransferase